VKRVLVVIRAIKAIKVIAEKREIKVNEENKVHREFLANEGSLESVVNKDRKVLLEPMVVMDAMEQTERTEETEKTVKMVLLVQ
jgi:sucrose-6-phosphate hydrolase SacC (GH32 family)